MTSMKKFMFDTSFESPMPPDLASSKSLPPGPAPGAEPQEAVADEPEIELPPLPSYSEEELEAARQEASQAGWEAGRKAALNEAEQAQAESLAAISGQLAALQQSSMASAEQHLCDTANLATVLVRKLFPKLNEHFGLTEIEALIGSCLGSLREEPRLVLRVGSHLLEPVREKVEALLPNTGFEGKLVYLGDDTMGASDVRLEWADGGAERDCERQWEEIDALIARALQSSAPAPEPSSDHSGTPEAAPAGVSGGNGQTEKTGTPVDVGPGTAIPETTETGTAAAEPVVEESSLSGDLS